MLAGSTRLLARRCDALPFANWSGLDISVFDTRRTPAMNVHGLLMYAVAQRRSNFDRTVKAESDRVCPADADQTR
jgi:hypothetical protein